MLNQELAKELHKPITIKLTKNEKNTHMKLIS